MEQRCFRFVCETVAGAWVIGVFVWVFSPEIERLVAPTYYPLINIAIWLFAAAVAFRYEWRRYRENVQREKKRGNRWPPCGRGPLPKN